MWKILSLFYYLSKPEQALQQKKSYKTKGNHTKGWKAYSIWEDKDKNSSSSLSLDDNEFSHLCLMAHKKEKGLEVYNYDFDFKPSYNQLLKVFREMHANA